MSPKEGSTQPYGPGTERLIERITGREGPERGASDGREQEQEVSHIKSTTTPADIDVGQLAEAFYGVSLTALPEARLVIAHPPWAGIKHPAVVPLARNVGSWDMVGVMQRTHDVRMTIDLPYHDPVTNFVNPRLIPYRLRCSIYYDPADDGCVLVNQSVSEIRLTSLESGVGRKCLANGAIALVTPGLWRISVASKAATEIHITDFIVLRRQFAVGVRQGPLGQSVKRKATDVHSISPKRQKQDVNATEGPERQE